jgi:hypothetical protein
MWWVLLYVIILCYSNVSRFLLKYVLVAYSDVTGCVVEDELAVFDGPIYT